MTIVVGAASPDGIILAADSRTTLSDGDRFRIASDAAEKVFELAERFGVATYGMAFIGNRTINGLMDEFLAQMGDACPDDVESFAQALGDFFHVRFVAEHGDEGPEQGWPLGFVVASYDESGIGHVWEVGIPGPSVECQPVNTADRGVLWRGQTDAIVRLIKGVDVAALNSVMELERGDLEKLANLEYILLHPTTLQDAADMASFLVRTTIDMQRFSDGIALSPGIVPGCGGLTQLLAVTRAGVEWVNKRWMVGPSKPGWAEGTVEGGYT